MKKVMPFYAIGWALALGLFNLITFITPGDKFDDDLWTISYILITVGFLALLGCAYYAFGSKSAEQNALFRLPLFKSSVTALIAVLVVGLIFMSIDGMPTWLGVIIIAVVICIYAVPILTAGAAASAVQGVDKQIKQQTAYIKMLTADTQVLMTRAQGTMNAEITRKVYEAARYSDPMSADGLQDVESRIRTAFAALVTAVNSNLPADEQAAILLTLIEERNVKCKILK